MQILNQLEFSEKHLDKYIKNVKCIHHKVTDGAQHHKSGVNLAYPMSVYIHTQVHMCIHVFFLHLCIYSMLIHIGTRWECLGLYLFLHLRLNTFTTVILN